MVARRVRRYNGENYRVWLSTGSGFASEVSWATRRETAITFLRDLTTQGHTYADLMDMTATGSPTWASLQCENYRVWLNTGSGFASEVSWGNASGPRLTCGINHRRSHYADLMDMNGDGLPDVGASL